MRPEHSQADTSDSPVVRFRQERGLSQNQVSIRTGIDRMTLARWEKGNVPGLEKVEHFARVYGLDVNRWRVANGCPPVEPTLPVETGEQAFWRLYGARYRALETEGIPMNLFTPYDRAIDWDNLTPERAAEMVDSLEQDSRRRRAER